ncbi:Cof-type HAD-IIB family hydrolase [Domibacillus mangrovi]|uniref:Hydrolase n=1 Tax=Domibacillus mangrovi TaxID=1714354 RepID=A0A1Q5P610_9BACI|nr:Cof-type HAD-IIB family hydrolase [Domibacillus mangrovi]OKL37532.1 hydrolase [Domibacillus mangrovi]
MITSIATDMDGTLLNGAMEVSEANRDAIKKAQKLGVEVIVATGRSYVEARFALEGSGIECPIIAVNGAEIRNEAGDIIQFTALEDDIASDIYHCLKDVDVYFEVCTNHGTYTDNPDKAVELLIDIVLSATPETPIEEIREKAQQRIKEKLILPIDEYEPLIHDNDHHIYKFFVFSTDDDVLQVASDRLAGIAGIVVSSSGNENLEVTSELAQKGIALEAFLASKGLSMNDAFAVGDNYNDLSMLEKVGYSYAMGNAHENIKRACRFETASNNENGVAQAIEDVLERSMVK